MLRYSCTDALIASLRDSQQIDIRHADNADGTHSLSSPSHLSLLLNKTFNISIPLQHIPLDQYEFEASDPADEEEQDSEDEDEEADFGGFGMAKGVEEVGRWKVKSTGKLVGEGGKGVKFTVIGYVFCQHLLKYIA